MFPGILRVLEIRQLKSDSRAEFVAINLLKIVSIFDSFKSRVIFSGSV
jgi:hypothetical protein